MTTTELQHLAKRIRVDIIRSTTAAGSGHLTSSLSSVELITGLLFGGTIKENIATSLFFIS
jgi:transketolase